MIEKTKIDSTMVSVLMCVYNDEKYVGSAIQSILDQTYKNFEFIIIDDGSVDGTSAILEKYQQKDERVKVFKIENSGTTVAANFGLSKAVGKYIARLDSDDISYPNRLQIEVDYLDKNPNVGLVGGGSDLIDMDGNIVGERNIKTSTPLKTLWKRCIYQQSDVMFNRELVVDLGGYREKFHNSQDYDLWLRISEKADIAKLDIPLGQWRLNYGGYTFSRRNEQVNDTRIVKEMAKLRRQNKSDNYETYVPNEIKKHRVKISNKEYQLVLIAANFLDLRLKEARSKIEKLIQTNKNDFKLYILLLATYCPKFILKFLLSFRTFIRIIFNQL